MPCHLISPRSKYLPLLALPPLRSESRQESFLRLPDALHERHGNLTPRPRRTWTVLPPSSVGGMTLRLYSALSYIQNSSRDLRCALNGA